MPPNLYRVASIWTELARLGFRWSGKSNLRAIELGAGPASGACGIAAGEHHARIGLPMQGNWALIEQDRAMLTLGEKWAIHYFGSQGFADWGIRPFQRKVDFSRGLLPKSAPEFNLWVMSYFLNEAQLSPAQLAASFVDSWERHLEEEGVVIFAEPALKLQSRRLLEVRKALIQEFTKRRLLNEFQILLPCLGHQTCGALEAEDDWCHEDVMWWRPPYFRVLDKMAELDRKNLPFSYLVIVRSKRTREEILPALAGTSSAQRHRLVSPSHSEGRDLEFFICGQEGKRRARYRPKGEEQEKELDRGDILATDVEIRGDVHASRIDSARKL